MLGFLEAGFSVTLLARSQADHNILSLLALSCFWDEFLMFGWPGNNLHRLEAAFISVSKLFWLQVQATMLGLGYRKDFKSGTTFILGREEMVGSLSSRSTRWAKPVPGQPEGGDFTHNLDCTSLLLHLPESQYWRWELSPLPHGVALDYNLKTLCSGIYLAILKFWGLFVAYTWVIGFCMFLPWNPFQ